MMLKIWLHVNRTGEHMNEDEQQQDLFVPPPQESFHYGIVTSSMSNDHWAWVQTVIDDLRT